MYPNNKPILVTGATGSIGSVLIRRLSEMGLSVRGLARSPARAMDLRRLENVEVIYADLRRPGSLRGSLAGCSVVIHCAAKLAGSNRAAFQEVNGIGTQALLDEAVRSEVQRFVHVSTVSVYGLGNAQNITEDFPCLPSDLPYITTKQESEQVVWEAARKLPVTIARLGDVTGPGQFTWTINLIKKINQGTLIPPTDSASGMLNPVYIDNLIDALLLLTTHPGAVNQAFNVVDGAPIRASDYIRRLAGMTGKRMVAVPPLLLKGAAALLMAADLIRGREAQVTPREVKYLLRKSTISGEKIRSRLGWKPLVDVEEGFRQTAKWLCQAGYLKNEPADY